MLTLFEKPLDSSSTISVDSRVASTFALVVEVTNKESSDMICARSSRNRSTSVSLLAVESTSDETLLNPCTCELAIDMTIVLTSETASFEGGMLAIDFMIPWAEDNKRSDLVEQSLDVHDNNTRSCCW